MGSDRQRPISPTAASPRSFFKIILPSVMQYHRLRIPENFSREYGNELSTSVKFTVRSGQDCRVGVEKADKMLWFTDGWKEFSEDHSIGFGYVVVFNYEGNSKFKVLIFDLTATEIYNPRKSLGICKEPNKGKQHPISQRGPSSPALVSLENGVLDGCRDQRRTGNVCCHSLIQKMYEFAPEFALRINKRGRCISSLESLRCTNFHYFTRNKRFKMEDHGKIVEVDKVTVSRKGTLKACEMPNSKRSSVHEAQKEKGNLMKNMDNLPATVPFGRHCSLSNGGRVEGLINREDKEVQHMQFDSVFVQEANLKRESIRYQLNETKHTKNADELDASNAANRKRNYSNGQQRKVKNQEEEQLCGLNDSRNDSMMRPVKAQEREKAVHASMLFKPNNPSFRKIMQPYNVQRNFILNVPAEFAKNNLYGVLDSMLLEVSGDKQWTAHCTRVSGHVRILSGEWGRFAKDNNLREGDVCVFELIQDVVLKVSIFRASEDTRQINLPD